MTGRRLAALILLALIAAALALFGSARTQGQTYKPSQGRIGSTGGPPPGPNWRQRLDLNADNFLTVVGDVLKFSGNVAQRCT